MSFPRWEAAPPLVCAALLLSNWCAAQERPAEPIVTDRPDFTESMETIPVGRIQIEGGYTFARTGDEKSDSLGELLLRVATGSRTELRLEINSYGWTRGPGGNASGLEDAFLGFKVKLSDGSGRLGLWRPAISLIGATSLPTVWFLVGTWQALAHCPPPVAAGHFARLRLAPRQLEEDVNTVLALVGRVAGGVLRAPRRSVEVAGHAPGRLSERPGRPLLAAGAPAPGAKA